MFNKKSSQLSFNITNAEKTQATKALIYFKHAKKNLKAASDYLDILYTPFKDNADITPEQIYKYRAALRRFRDKSISNFKAFKILAFECVNVMQDFSSDTQILKLINNFISVIDDLQTKVNSFVDEFKDLNSKDFQKNLVKCIDDIKKISDQLEDIIENRISGHVQENILSSTWIDDISKELNKKIEKKKPLLIDLFNEDKEKFNKGY